MPSQLWVICFVPVISAICGWVIVYRSRDKKGPELVSGIALILCTVSALIGALGTVYLVYFTCVPRSTQWTALPEYRLDGCVMLFALGSVVIGFIALMRGHSRTLCGTVLLTSGWLIFFSIMHASTA